MSVSAHFKEQFITFFAALGEVTPDAFFALTEAEQDSYSKKLRTVQAAAYAQVKATYKDIPGYLKPYVEHDMSYAVEQFDLTTDDIELEARKASTTASEQLSFGIAFFTEQRLDNEVIDAMAALVYKAYADAGAAESVHAAPLGMETQVTEWVTTTTLRPARSATLAA